MIKLLTSLPAELQAWNREIEHHLDLARDPARCATTAPTASHWSVRDHLEHLVRADTGILEWLHRAARGEETDSGGRPTAIGHILLFFGAIPRGKGQAPRSTRPEGQDAEAIIVGLDRTLELARSLHEYADRLSQKSARMRHPVFGHLSPYQWIRFAHIHNRHHRLIMTDILARSS